MNRRTELALKKQILLLDCAVQRQQLSEYTTGMRPAFAVADKANNVAHWLQQHPALSAAVGAFVLVLRPRYVLRWSTRAWSAWRVMQRLRGRA